MTTPPEKLPTLSGSVPPVREWARTFAIGLCMGSADAVPGVSGGTIALIAGIYGRLIAMINALTPTRIVTFLKALTPLDGGFDLRGALYIFDEVDGWFGLALVTGIGVAVVAITRAVAYLVDAVPALLFGFFFGLIAVSAVILLRELSIESTFQIAAGVVGFVLAFGLAGEQEFLGTGSLLIVFVAGAVAVSAMILPGISGSLLLVILGQYARMSKTLSDFIDGLARVATGGPAGQLGQDGLVVVTFIAGGFVGVFTIGKVVRTALDRNRTATMTFLVMLVVGALRAPVVATQAETPNGFTTEVLLLFAAAAVVGSVFLLVLDWFAVDLDLDSV
jgi:putative membrane protein